MIHQLYITRRAHYIEIEDHNDHLVTSSNFRFPGPFFVTLIVLIWGVTQEYTFQKFHKEVSDRESLENSRSL